MNKFTPEPSYNQNSKLSVLIQGFQELFQIADPIWFAVEFERRQKDSNLRLATYRQAFQAWTRQQREDGGLR